MLSIIYNLTMTMANYLFVKSNPLVLSFPDDSQTSGESMHWRDRLANSSFNRVHKDGPTACFTPSDMSGLPSPVHASSPVHAQERY